MSATADPCGCDPLRPPAPVVENPPAQPALRWRVAPHNHALARMEHALGARRDAEDPAHALLDAWAVVADVVSFYTERIAQEGYLRTATEIGSVRLLARAIGHELRPGVAAEAEIAFEVEDAPGAPVSVEVPAGTPIGSIPGPGELPQTFETSAALEARPAWNAIPAALAEDQLLLLGATRVWARGIALGLRAGDHLLLVDEDRAFAVRPVVAVTEAAEGNPGWTLLDLAPAEAGRFPRVFPGPFERPKPATAHAFARRAPLFGANAPDPALLLGADGTPLSADGSDWDGIEDPFPEGSPDVVELDGDQPRVLAGSWFVLEDTARRSLYAVADVSPGGDARFGLSGKLTRVRVDDATGLEGFGRRDTVAHCESRALDTAEQPVAAPLGGSTLRLVATDPPLAPGRSVVVSGFAPGTVPADPLAAAATPPTLAEPAVVVSCTVTGATMTVRLDRALVALYDPRTLRVRANVVAATHGETVQQVLGSGDAAQAFQRMVTRKGPLTHVRAPTPSGTATTLEVRVDDVRWEQVASLDTAAPDARVVSVREDDEGIATIIAGDGAHGARLPTGAENVHATYRAGIGAAGALAAGQLSLLPRRPLGIRGALNPGPAHDWAEPEPLAEARVNAPLAIRTLDRAVSIADHGDFAAGFAGVALARADGVWDGREEVVVVSLLGPGAAAVGDGLLADLGAALAAARDPASRFVLLRGEVVLFGLRVEVAHDPAHDRAVVEASVTAALTAALAAPALGLGGSLAHARALVIVRSTPGVLACTMPRLLAVTSAAGAPVTLAPDDEAQDVLVALPGRHEDGALLSAQALGLVAGGIEIGVMAP